MIQEIGASGWAAEALYNALAELYPLPPRPILFDQEETAAWAEDEYEYGDGDAPGIYYSVDGWVLMRSVVDTTNIFLKRQSDFGLDRLIVEFRDKNDSPAHAILEAIGEYARDDVYVHQDGMLYTAAEYLDK